MSRVLEILERGLDHEIGRSLRTASDNLRRQLRFLHDTKKPQLATVSKRGYSHERLSVILDLAAFFHIVVAPLAASGRDTTSGLVTKLPVLHGSNVFDKESSHRSRAMEVAFYRVLGRLHIRTSWLSILNADDITWRIARSLDEDSHGD